MFMPPQDGNIHESIKWLENMDNLRKKYLNELMILKMEIGLESSFIETMPVWERKYAFGEAKQIIDARRNAATHQTGMEMIQLNTD